MSQKFRTKKPVNAYFLTVAKYVFWIFLIITFIRGVNSWVNGGQGSAEGNYEPPYVLSGASQGFASAFTIDYLTYDPKESEDYLNRVSPYFAKSLRATIPLETTSLKGPMKVVSANVIDIKEINENKADIVLKVDLVASVPQALEGSESSNDSLETKFEELKYSKYLQVPVAYKNDSFFVFDYPTFVNSPVNSEEEAQTIPELSTVDDGLKNEMEKMTNDFFKTFSEGTSSQIAIYMLDGKELKGYEGSFIFKSLKGIQVLDFTNKDGDQEKKDISDLIVYTESAWEDSETGLITNQHHTFLFTQENERWLIQRFSGGWKQW